MKVYIDGCSLTYGQGLSRDKSLGQLLVNIGNHQVMDKSRPAKSNQAIIADTWNNRNNYDVYFLGFTYSNRYHIKFRNLDIDLYPSKITNINYQKYNDSIIEDAVSMMHKGSYILYDGIFYSQQSDILVDMIISKLKSLKKIVIPYSWEKRTIDSDIFYPIYTEEFHISKTDPHLNEKGTKHLFDTLQLKLLEELEKNEK
jgi:hypothetical protein